MPRTGLSKRLQQQSRRSGFAVGISMVAAIAVCFAAFSWIYVQLEPWVQDFAGAEDAPPTATARPAAENQDDQDEEEAPAPTDTPEPDAEPTVEEEPEIEGAPVDEVPTEGAEEPNQFEPDYVVSAGQDVNFRSEPSTAAGGATVIEPIPNGTQLQTTGETAPADTPDNGPWIQFELEDGTEGWLREIDVSPT